MITKDNIAEATGTINQRFLMLVQALSAIRELTSITLNSLKEDELLAAALDVLNQNLDLERCSIFLLNNEDELYCVAGQDREDQKNMQKSDKKQSHTFKLGQGIIGQAAEKRQLIHCRHCKQDKNYLSIIPSRTDQNSGSLICMPIMAGEMLMGVLNVSHPEPQFFHPWQEHIINIHANILAQMLYNHRLMEDMETQVSNRTKELQLSLDETETLKSRYHALSVIDDLTQIHNRRYFFSEVPSALARSLRYQQSLSLLCIDLDHFKSINDTYGHEMGDNVLKDVALVLSRQSRKVDILARMGGEEFALAIPNTDFKGIQLLAGRIKDSVSRLNWEYEGQSFGITLSIGVAELKLPKRNEQYCLQHINEIIHVLVREADQALYYCKKIGRDTVTFYRDL